MLDIKEQYYKFIHGKKCKIFEAVLIQPTCPFCGSIFNASKLKVLSASYELMQDFISALKNHDGQALKALIFSKEPVGELMHKTLMTFCKK